MSGYPELNRLLIDGGLPELDEPLAERFLRYKDLLLRWNERVSLTSIRDEHGILSRHFVESIACARLLPAGIATLLDYGSGAGFPGLPIAICRPEIRVTLAESQNKKAAFLREAVRVVAVDTAVYASRVETIEGQFDCVVLRAVERMAEAAALAVELVSPGGWVGFMTTVGQRAAFERIGGLEWESAKAIPGSKERILLLGKRAIVPRETARI